MNIGRIIKEKQGTVVDVRTPQEYRGGNVPGSINIPIQEIPGRVEELKTLQMPLVLCCASGARSEQVYHYLSHQGIECVNGGPWQEVNSYRS